MANKYCNLEGTQKISVEYPKINEGFDRVDIDVSSIITGQDLDPNKDIELLNARGGLPTLGDRLNVTDSKVVNLEIEIDTTGDALNARIDNIIATPTTVSEQEIMDARQGEISLGANLSSIKNDSVQKLKLNNKIVDGKFTDPTKWTLTAPWSLTASGAYFDDTSINYIFQPTPIIANHVYSFVFKIQTEGMAKIAFNSTSSVAYVPPQNYATGIHVRNFTYPTTVASLRIYGYSSESAFTLESMVAIDWTEIFGAGNEPTQEEVAILIERLGTQFWEDYTEVEQSNYIKWLIENEKESVPLSKWDNKNWYSYGTSITWQDGKAWAYYDKVGEIARGYQTVAKELLGMIVNNQGASGSALAKEEGIVTNLVNYFETTVPNLSAVDFITIDHGVNDYGHDNPIGTLGNFSDDVFDITTFYGAYRHLLNKIIKDYPNIRIVLGTPIQSRTQTPNNIGVTIADYRDAVIKIGEMYSLPVCDFWANAGLNYFNHLTFYPDGLHPNEVGHELMGRYLASVINSL